MFAAHKDLEDVFLSSWKQYKVDASKGEISKMVGALHSSIQNFRKKHTRPHLKVCTMDYPYVP